MNLSGLGNVLFNVRMPFLALLLAVSPGAFAQRSVTVHVPAGDVVAFASQGRATAPPIDPVVPRQGVATVELGEEQDRLYIWDRSANRVASAPAKDEWSPQVADLVDLAQVTVELRHNGKMVSAANVTLDDGRRKQDVLVDPGAKGDATFFDVKPGSLKATVRYRAAGKDADPVTQVFETRPRGDAVPHFTIALPEAAETMDAPQGPAPSPEPSGSKPATGSGSNVVGALIAVVVAGCAAAGIYFYIKQNSDAVGGTLEKLGAQIPKSGDAPLADPPVAAAPAAAAPAPPQKIVLDPAPAPISVAPISLGSTVSVSEPSLVSDSGIPIPLVEGETVVGREVGLGLSLAGETTVSRRHARIVRTGGTATLEDLGSTNGTFVNGAPAGGSVALQPGDAVQFGSVRFRYEG